MKYLVRVFIAIVLSITATYGFSGNAVPQGLSSSGTDFWLGFMPNGDPSLGGMVPQMRLFIASSTKNKVSVSIGSATTSYSLVPNEIKDIHHIISPDTLPPLVRVLDSTCGNYTLRFYEPRTIATGYSFDDTRI